MKYQIFSKNLYSFSFWHILWGTLIAFQAMASQEFPYQDLERQVHEKLGISKPNPEDVSEEHNQVFIVTNEHNTKSVSQQLKDRSFLCHENQGRRILVGTSGADLLNLAISSNADYLIVIDNSPAVVLFWHKLREIILNASGPREVEKELYLLITENPKWFSGFNYEDLHKHFFNRLIIHGEKSRLSWLSNTGNFDYVQKLVRQGLIICHFSFLDLEKIAALREWISDSEKNLLVDTAYLSNIISWVQRAPNYYSDDLESQLNKSLKTLLTNPPNIFEGPEYSCNTANVVYSKRVIRWSNTKNSKEKARQATRYLSNSPTDFLSQAFGLSDF